MNKYKGAEIKIHAPVKYENKKVGVPFYHALPDFRNNASFWTVPRLRPFVLVLAANVSLF